MNENNTFLTPFMYSISPFLHFYNNEIKQNHNDL